MLGTPCNLPLSDLQKNLQCSGSSIAAELEKMKPVEHIRLQEANITMGPMALLGPCSFKVHF